jgi:hypothetical protein
MCGDIFVIQGRSAHYQWKLIVCCTFCFVADIDPCHSLIIDGSLERDIVLILLLLPFIVTGAAEDKCSQYN